MNIVYSFVSFLVMIVLVGTGLYVITELECECVWLESIKMIAMVFLNTGVIIVWVVVLKLIWRG